MYDCFHARVYVHSAITLTATLALMLCYLDVIDSMSLSFNPTFRIERCLLFWASVASSRKCRDRLATRKKFRVNRPDFQQEETSWRKPKCKTFIRPVLMVNEFTPPKSIPFLKSTPRCILHHLLLFSTVVALSITWRRVRLRHNRRFQISIRCIFRLFFRLSYLHDYWCGSWIKNLESGADLGISEWKKLAPFPFSCF